MQGNVVTPSLYLLSSVPVLNVCLNNLCRVWPFLHYIRYNLKPVICGVRDFSAEEDTIYCPRWVLLKTGCGKQVAVATISRTSN